MALTAAEKAKELLRNYSFIEYDQNNGVKIINDTLHNAAKQCALICVEEMISQWEEVFHAYGIGYTGEAKARNNIEKSKRWQYLQQIKEEIQKL